MYKTVLYWDSISLVLSKNHATGDAAKTVNSSKGMSKEESGHKESTSLSTLASLKR